MVRISVAHGGDATKARAEQGDGLRVGASLDAWLWEEVRLKEDAHKSETHDPS